MLFQVNGTGRLGKDAELKHFENGNSVLEFSVASNEVYTPKEGDKVENTFWHDIKLYGKNFSEKFVARLTKGAEVTILGGKLKDNTWEKDGVSHTRTFVEIRTSNIKLCGVAPSSTDEAPQAEAAPAAAPATEEKKDSKKKS